MQVVSIFPPVGYTLRITVLILPRHKEEIWQIPRTLLAYAGLRISEALNIQLTDFNLTVGELKVRGKGDKDRVVYLNDKIINSIREFLRVRESESPCLFANSNGKVIHRSTVNKYSDKISPLIHYDIIFARLLWGVAYQFMRLPI